MSNQPAHGEPETALDDVRRVREQLHRDSGGNIRLKAQKAQAIADKLREKLGVVPAAKEVLVSSKQ